MTDTATGTIVTKKRLADLLGVTRHAVARMVAEGCPYRERGGREGGQTEWSFDTAAVVRWLRETDVQAEIDRLESGGEMLKRFHPDDPRHEERVTATELRKLELAELQGSRILKEDARQQLAEEYEIVRAGLRKFPREAAKRIAALAPGRVDVKKVEEVLSREVEGAMENLDADSAI